MTPQQLEVIKDRFHSFLGGNSNIVADEAFFNAVQSYYEVFIRSPRIARMVESGGATAADFRDVFKNNIDKRIRNLPEIDGLSLSCEKMIFLHLFFHNRYRFFFPIFIFFPSFFFENPVFFENSGFSVFYRNFKFSTKTFSFIPKFSVFYRHFQFSTETFCFIPKFLVF